MKPSFYYQQQSLFCENTNLNQFAQTHKTPFYLYSKNELLNNCQAIVSAGKGSDFLPCYALKANYNPTLLRLIRDMGFGADVVSGGELEFALKTGFPAERIVFAGVGKSAEEIEFAIRSGIHSLNIESAEELEQTARIAEKLQKKVRIALRVNPDIDAHTHEYISTGKHINKFGITIKEALTLYPRAASHPWLHPSGIHVHIGSQITEKGPFLKTVDFLLEFAAQLKSMNVPISYLDLGGGIGVNYENDFRNPEAANSYINDILPAYINGLKGSGLKLVAELGRSVIATSGLLVTQVLYRKQTPVKKFVVVDAAMNNLIRPSLYSAYHEIVPLQLNTAEKETVDIVGPVCESGDFFAKERAMQPLEQGDYIAVTAAGAYGQALASNYNLRPDIPEYLVDSDSVETIYKGRSINEIYNQYEQ